MLQAMNRDRVRGFLDTRGTKLVNERGQEVLLTGWGLGNWLLPEGYMWLAGGPRMDRPRTIERIVEEVAGREYAARFWKRFRENYIRREDIARMAELGYNSVRIPINARLFLEEGPGLNWVDEGFALLDRCIDWCEEFGVYAFIDLHGAPGGQTGSNIDDSIDNLPRLFTDEDSFWKGVELWRKLAERYCDRWIVGGYDILNEPLRPAQFEGQQDTACLLPELRRFYHEAIAAIRSVDQKHVLSIEGHHWASDPEIFDEKFDDKLLIHFHRYACLPDRKCYDPFIEASERLGSPLWLGETGENVHEWFAAMYPLAAELGIGFNIWPWKKMNCKNSPYSVNKPEGWDAITAYAKGGPHPGYEQAQAALDEYLDNMLLENCAENAVLHDAIFRRPGCTIRATDFDEVGGEGVAYHSVRKALNPFGYREDTGMEIVEKQKDAKKEFGFDCLWRRFALGLEQGEYACYTLNDISGIVRLEVHCSCSGAARVSVWQDGEQLGVYPLGGIGSEKLVIGGLRLRPAERSVLRIQVESGRVEVDSLVTLREKIAP